MIRCGVLGDRDWAVKLQVQEGTGVVALGDDLRRFRPEQHRGVLDVLVVTAAALARAAASPGQVHDSLRRLLPDCVHVCLREPGDPACDGWPVADLYTWPDDAFGLFRRLHHSDVLQPAPSWWEEAATALPEPEPGPGAVTHVPAGLAAVGTIQMPQRLPAPQPLPGPEPPSVPLLPAAAPLAGSAPGKVATGQLVSVIGAKGGVGQTWLAVNLAVALSNRVGMECLLADLDLAGADVGVYLDLLGAPTVVDLVQQADEETWPWAGLHQLRSCPLRVLTGPERPEMASLLTPAAVDQTVKTLQERFAFTICDHAPGDTDPLFQTISERAAAIVLVTTLDAPALRQAKLRLDHLRQRGLHERTHLVFNGAAAGGVSAPDASAYLEHVSYTVVPADRKRVEQSIHEARPLALQPATETGRAVQALAAALLGDAADTATTEPGWRRWLEQLWKR